MPGSRKIPLPITLLIESATTWPRVTARRREGWARAVSRGAVSRFVGSVVNGATLCKTAIGFRVHPGMRTIQSAIAVLVLLDGRRRTRQERRDSKSGAGTLA